MWGKYTWKTEKRGVCYTFRKNQTLLPLRSIKLKIRRKGWLSISCAICLRQNSFKHLFYTSSYTLNQPSLILHINVLVTFLHLVFSLSYNSFHVSIQISVHDRSGTTWTQPHWLKPRMKRGAIRSNLCYLMVTSNFVGYKMLNLHEMGLNWSLCILLNPELLAKSMINTFFYPKCNAYCTSNIL